MKKFFSLIFLFCICANLFSQYDYLLQGKIGKHKIIMQLSKEDDSTLTARYFYINHLQDIFLRGNFLHNKDKVLLNKNEWNYDKSKYVFCEKFSLSTTNQKMWKGYWTNGKKKLSVQLVSIDTNAIILNPKKEYDFDEGFDRYYSHIRERNIRLQKDSITKINQLTLQWFSDSTSKVNLFRVVAGIDDLSILHKVNKCLQNFQLNEIMAFYDCPNNDRKYGYYNYWINDVYVTDNFLSVDAHIDCDCGGVHPNSFPNYLNLNLHSGNIIEKITDVFALADSNRHSKKEWKEAMLLIEKSQADHTFLGLTIDDTIGCCILNIFNTLYSKEISADKIDDHCRYYDYEQWMFFSFVFTNVGVYISPEFPHAIQGCSYPDWAIIPYSILKKYLKSTSKITL